MIRIPRLLALVSAALLGWACNSTTPNKPEEPERPPGLQAIPERLAYLCVTPGCDTTEAVTVRVNGPRRVAIKRILLEGEAASEFTFEPSEAPPFIVGTNASFEVAVRYAPVGAPISGGAELRITYTDAEAEESPDRLEPGELVIPLVRRLVGEPVLSANPEILSFGVVPTVVTQTLPLTVGNEGFGNIAVEIAGMESESPDVTAKMPEAPAMGPGETQEVEVTWAPSQEGYLSTRLTIHATAPDVFPAVVQVEGTSLNVPRVAFEPEGDIDFGLLAKEKTRSLTTTLVNQGGLDLQISSVTVDDPTGNVTVDLADNGAMTLAALERAEVPITVTGVTPGPVDAVITVSSNDPQNPAFVLHVRGLVTEPRLTLTPQALDWGTVPVGWVVTRPVELKNTGWGKLTIENITLVSGSSTLFTLGGLPALPLTLEREQRIAVDVEFRAETSAAFTGFLSVESDDPVNNFLEVELTATAGSCQDSCPIANGTPSCQSGTCEVGSCNTGFYDTDQSAASGCECQEIGQDPGEFCQGSVYKGTLNDNDGDQTNHTGVIPTPDDEDLIRFWAEDGFKLFDEEFDVKIRLTSSDPGIQFCVYRHDGGHSNECYFTNESCPGSRYYQKGGSGGGGDDADFTIKVFRNASFNATCSSYTLFMSNGI